MVVLTAVAVFLNGCNDESNDIAVGGANLPAVNMDVVAPPSGEAAAFVTDMAGSDPGQPLELEEGKSFWGSAEGSEPVKMDQHGSLEHEFLFTLLSFEDDLPFAAKLDPAANNRYYIAYNEDGSAEGASYVTVPEPFQITAPLAHEEVSVVNDLVVKWDAADDIDEVGLHAAVFCDGRTDEFEWHSAWVSNTGSHMIFGGWYPHQITEPCTLTIEVAAGREGVPGLGFDGSEVMGYRTSTVTLIVTN